MTGITPTSMLLGGPSTLGMMSMGIQSSHLEATPAGGTPAATAMSGKHSKVSPYLNLLNVESLNFLNRDAPAKSQDASRNIVNASKPVSFAVTTASVANARTSRAQSTVRWSLTILMPRLGPALDQLDCQLEF